MATTCVSIDQFLLQTVNEKNNEDLFFEATKEELLVLEIIEQNFPVSVRARRQFLSSSDSTDIHFVWSLRTVPFVIK